MAARYERVYNILMNVPGLRRKLVEELTQTINS